MMTSFSFLRFTGSSYGQAQLAWAGRLAPRNYIEDLPNPLEVLFEIYEAVPLPRIVQQLGAASVLDG